MVTNKSHLMDNASNVNQDRSFNSNLASNNNNKDSLIIHHQNITGVSNKVDELPNLWPMRFPHILCYSEHHLKDTETACISINYCQLGSYYCRKLVKMVEFTYSCMILSCIHPLT
jgi:hypothetical protein